MLKKLNKNAMKHLLILLLVIPALLSAQTQKKYLAGAVPEIDGKVVFTKTINTQGVPKEIVFDTLLAWAKKYFNGTEREKSRIVFVNPEDGEIAAMGEEFLVFADKALMLDCALINYQTIIECEDNSCQIKITNIRYSYDVAYQKQPEKYIAEEWITDKYALTSKGKLMRGNGKFRTKTVDMVEKIFNEADKAVATLVENPTEDKAPDASKVHTAQTDPNVTALPAVTADNSSEKKYLDYKQISPANMPEYVTQMLTENWMLLTAGDENKTDMTTAYWGGLGNMLNKTIATCFIVPTETVTQLMEKNDTYTLTFYTKSNKEALEYSGNHSGKEADKIKKSGLTPITTPAGGQAFSEAWLIIECKKLVSQPLDSSSNKIEKDQWTGKPATQMYAGEIVNIWIK